MQNSSMFKYFFKREILDKYKGNLTGITWVFIQPIIILLIYTLVFEKIFNTKFPEAENIGFIVYLAIGFWPWTAFSEAVLKSITVIVDKKDLIGKVKMDFKISVYATVTANFMLNIIGYIIVLVVLIASGKEFNYSALPLLIFPILQLYFFALALGLILSSIQIFIKDTLNLITTLMTLWFFMTPIIYSISMMPDYLKNIIKINPIYTPISFIHTSLLTNKPLPWIDMIVLSIAIGILLWLGIKQFNRLAPKFSDYL